jgi:hypothetical protein
MSIAANRMTGFRTFMLAFGFCECAAGQPATAFPPIPWGRMIWSLANVGGKTVEHAALMVEVQLKGVEKPVLMQLDTGCDADLVYDIPFGLLDPGGARAGRNQVLLGGTVGGRQFEREPFFIRGTAGVSWLSSLLLSAQERIAIWKGKEVLQGMIGAAFLEQRVLLLDFVANRVAILGAGEELPAALAAHVEFTPIAYRDHKIFVGVAVNGSTRRDLAFDTGSSTAALITTRDRLRRRRLPGVSAGILRIHGTAKLRFSTITRLGSRDCDRRASAPAFRAVCWITCQRGFTLELEGGGKGVRA